MFLLLRRSSLNPLIYTRRSYVVSEGDDFSAQRAVEFEESIDPTTTCGELSKNYDIYTVPRARKIHQSLLTTPPSAFRCCLACASVLRGSNKPSPEYPDLIICNGPGTAVCIVFVGLVLKFFGARGAVGKMRTIYVESFARVRTLSLSGKILKWACDRFIVQWERLKVGRAEYLGVLV
ncbi:MAG: UDP-N-acetylglucosamine transferase subunit [Geoglossum umbratile]|nr:MAG: UDP-N-acetylglucosamine transferase subunit [Geoglossum umbratile]